MPAYAVDDLVYDPVAHKTTTPDGVDVPHVTTILSETGVSTNFGALAQVSERAARNIEYGRDRGSAVHADCHAYDDDDLVWSTVDPRIEPYVQSWAETRNRLRLTPLTHARERRVFHPIYFYTGILDGIFMTDDERRVLIDLKTGDPEDAACRYQTAAYEAAWLEAHPDQPIDARWAVWLRPERRIPYIITNYSQPPDDAWRDFSTFQAFLVTYSHQAVRRRRNM